MRSVVVLPQPEEPSSTVISPPGISIVRFPTATVPSGYRFVTSLRLIKGGDVVRRGSATSGNPQ